MTWWNRAFPWLVIAAIIVFMWRQARHAENLRMGARPKGDTRRLLLASVVLAVLFVVVLYVLPVIAARVPWNFGALSGSAAIGVVLGTLILFGVGLFFSRHSEGRPTRHLVKDVLLVFSAAALIILGILVVERGAVRLGVPEPWNVWVAFGFFGFVLMAKRAIERRRRLTALLKDHLRD